MINITDNRIDLQNSFEKIKASIEIIKMKSGHPMSKYCLLEQAIEEHLKECTLPKPKEGENSNDDIPEGLFERMGKLLNPDNNKLK